MNRAGARSHDRDRAERLVSRLPLPVERERGVWDLRQRRGIAGLVVQEDPNATVPVPCVTVSVRCEPSEPMLEPVYSRTFAASDPV